MLTLPCTGSGFHLFLCLARVFCGISRCTLSCSSSQALANLSALWPSLSTALSAPKPKLGPILHCAEGTVCMLGADGVLWCTGISWLWRNYAAASLTSPSTTCFCNSLYTSPHSSEVLCVLLSPSFPSIRDTALKRKPDNHFNNFE